MPFLAIREFDILAVSCTILPQAFSGRFPPKDSLAAVFSANPMQEVYGLSKIRNEWLLGAIILIAVVFLAYFAAIRLSNRRINRLLTA